MAARSDSKEDVYEWLWQVITSCENNEQHAVTGNLIHLFTTQYQDAELIIMLRNHRTNKWDELYNKSKGILLKG
jgi:hypothetical protein